MKVYTNPGDNVKIEAKEIHIQEDVQFGKDISIKCRGIFTLGAHAKIGDGLKINGENISIGDDFYYGPTLGGFMEMGGGGSNFPFADLVIGSGCVMHTGYINLARAVYIGNNVGLSHDVNILTHGFWHSVFDGGTSTFRPVHIGDDVIVGWKSLILAGVKIGNKISIGANSTVTKDLIESGIYAGSPAKFIKEIKEPKDELKQITLNTIIDTFKELLLYYEVPQISTRMISAEYPHILINELVINVENLTCVGTHDVITDAFRDFLRRYGIRIHAPHGFSFNLKRKE